VKPTAAIEKRAARSEPVSTLTPAASKLAGASLAENTRRAYQSALNRIQGYLREQGQDLTALDDSQLAEYITALHESGSSPASAALACAAVRFLAKATGQPSPAGPLSGRVLAGIRRQGKDRGRGQVQGLQWSQADTAAALASNRDRSLAGLRDAALIALMSDCLLRVSEAVALDLDALKFESDGTGRLSIRHSKTDQEGQGETLFVGAPTISRIRAWITGAGIASGPLFRRVRRGDVVGDAPLSTQAARAIIKRRATAADLQGRFSGHSLRVGSAQSLAASGASLVEMQTAGRWQSPNMPGRYARGELAARGAIARLRYGK
jgi:site-specific recombinase XerD